MAETIFSKIIRKEIPANIVYEDDLVLAFHDIAPQAPIHIVVISREEIPTANEINKAHEPLIGHMVRVAAGIAREQGIAENGYRLVMNCNADGGQAVRHIHFHLLGGRAMSWPPG